MGSDKPYESQFTSSGNTSEYILVKLSSKCTRRNVRIHEYSWCERFQTGENRIFGGVRNRGIWSQIWPGDPIGNNRSSLIDHLNQTTWCAQMQRYVTWLHRQKICQHKAKQRSVFWPKCKPKWWTICQRMNYTWSKISEEIQRVKLDEIQTVQFSTGGKLSELTEINPVQHSIKKKLRLERIRPEFLTVFTADMHKMNPTSARKVEFLLKNWADASNAWFCVGFSQFTEPLKFTKQLKAQRIRKHKCIVGSVLMNHQQK